MAAVHEDLARGDGVKVGSDRNFGFVFAGFFGLVGAVQAIGGSAWSLAWFAAAAIMLALALTRSRLLHPANLLWFRFGLLLHRIVSPVVLGLLFFGVITPVALIMRLLGRRPCQLRLDRKAGGSYWMARPKPADGTGTTRFEHQF